MVNPDVTLQLDEIKPGEWYEGQCVSFLAYILSFISSSLAVRTGGNFVLPAAYHVTEQINVVLLNMSTMLQGAVNMNDIGHLPFLALKIGFSIREKKRSTRLAYSTEAEYRNDHSASKDWTACRET